MGPFCFRLLSGLFPWQVFPTELIPFPSWKMAVPSFHLLRLKPLEFPELLSSCTPTSDPPGSLCAFKRTQNLITCPHPHCCLLGASRHPHLLLPMVLAFMDESLLNYLLLAIDGGKLVIFDLYHSFYFLLVGILFKK